MSKTVQAINWRDTADARNRVSEVVLDSNDSGDNRVILNGTDINGQSVFAHYLTVDNLDNIAPISVTINGIENTVSPYTRITYGLGNYCPDINVSLIEGQVKLYISERNLGIPDEQNQLASGNAFDMGIYLNRDGTAPMLAPLDFGNFRGINVANPINAQDISTKFYTDRYQYIKLSNYKEATDPDDTLSFGRAFTAIGARGGTIELDAVDVIVSSTIAVPENISIVGKGTHREQVATGPTRIVRAFAGADPTMTFAGMCAISHLTIDNDNQGTGVCAQVLGERFNANQVTFKRGGKGLWIGDVNNDGINCNLWFLNNCAAIYNAAEGFYFHHTNTLVSGTFPLGAPDCNGGTAIGCEAKLNGGNGFDNYNTIDNKFMGCSAQNNNGSGGRCQDYARGIHWYGFYTEANANNELVFDALSENCIAIGNMAIAPTSGWINNGIRNLIIEHNSNVTDSFIFGKTMALADFTAGGSAQLNLYSDVNAILAGYIRTMAGTGSGGKVALGSKVNGNVPIDRLTIDEIGNFIMENMAVPASSQRCLIMKDAVAPTANPVGGGVFYVEAGALKYRGSGGTVTVVAPA